MGRIVVTEFVSLDGVMEAPGGGEGFKYAGWSFDTDMGEDGGRFKGEELDTAEAFLLGRRTYQEFAAAWPSIDEFTAYNDLPKYVVSSTLGDAEATWGPTTVLRGDVATEVAKVKEGVTGDLLVQGSAQLVQALIEHDLVDELHLMVHPVVLGAGKSVFGPTSDKKTWRVTENRTVGDGVVLLILQRA